MFTMNGLVYFSTVVLIVGVNADPNSCFLGATAQCETANRQRFATSANDTNPDLAYCDSMRKTVKCGSEIDCDGNKWDPTDDFFTYLIDFLADSGVCGEESQVNECGQASSQACLRNLAVDMAGGDVCLYYGNYARCLIEQTNTCDDGTLLIVGTLMMDQLAENKPTSFGGNILEACPDWSSEFEDFIYRK